MVMTFGNNIVGAYTGGSSVNSIYAFGSLVWSQRPPKEYYIRWTPSNISSGTFSIAGVTYNFSDYNGYFSDFNGSITSSAFASTSIETIETNAYSIGGYAFYNCSSLITASLSECENLDYGVFKNCTSLQELFVPECKMVSDYAFRSCHSLVSISLPLCSYLGCEAFYCCFSLKTTYAPNARLDSHVFRYCSELETVVIPQLSSVPHCTFLGDHSLLSIDLTICSWVGDGAFQDCYNIESFSVPLLEYIDNTGFGGCSNSLFTSIVLPVCSYIGEWGFARCYNLKEVTLGYSSVCSLGYTSAEKAYYNFLSTPISAIYVPSSLVSAYKTAPGWTSLKNKIYPISQ